MFPVSAHSRFFTSQSAMDFKCGYVDGLAEVLAARRACALNNVPKNRQKQFYKRLGKLPDVSISFKRLEKDLSITDMGTKTMSAVTLLHTMKVNDEPSDRGTVRAFQVLDLVDKKIRAEAAAVLGTVNGHKNSVSRTPSLSFLDLDLSTHHQSVDWIQYHLE